MLLRCEKRTSFMKNCWVTSWWKKEKWRGVLFYFPAVQNNSSQYISERGDVGNALKTYSSIFVYFYSPTEFQHLDIPSHDLQIV